MKYGSITLLISVIYGSQRVKFWYFSHMHKSPLNTHADVLSKARGLVFFCRILHLYLYFVYASLHICAGLHKPSLPENVINTVKPVLRGHSKIDKTKVLKPCGSSMQVKSIAECFPWSILQYF